MILHIANDYSGSTVYRNLVKQLDNLGVKQIVYNPVREEKRIGKNEISFSVPDSKIYYRKILNGTTDRILYRKKINKIAKDIEKTLDLSKVSIIHAHTWYSDGGAAYLLAKKYNIPYIITVRNTDLNLFQKYLIHQQPFGRRVLEKAKYVVLIAASYKDRLLAESSLRQIKSKLTEKIRVIPNGVDAYWINGAVEKKKKADKQNFNFLFIGKFTHGKNVQQLQQAVNEINKERPIVHLHLIGGGGKAHAKVLEQVAHNPDTMHYHGKVFDLPKLKEYFDMADVFTMPSKQETFGLVYVEALLQGMPILYTEQEGIDGYYEEKIGEKVGSREVEEIKQKLLKLMKDYDTYVIPKDKLIENHDWNRIALTYTNLYSTMKNRRV